MTVSQSAQKPASGRFVLRLDPSLHGALRAAAADCGLSLNEHCARRLAAPDSHLTAVAGVTATQLRALRLFGPQLLGVVVYGSWARGDAAVGSDVDVLVVVGGGVELTRSLYRRWDQEPLMWDGHEVEPHFVHLPEASDRVTGLWAEVACDGIVVFERQLCVSRHLIKTRSHILGGRLRRRAHFGQPYWVEETADEEP